MDTKLVSVILPSYNRCEKIHRAINSVLSQTYSNLELIIVDDGSIDNTEVTVNAIKDKSETRVSLILVYLLSGINLFSSSLASVRKKAVSV